MELDRYRALVCAIETGSLSAAAEALQYTPSGVSRMVAALEEETGVPLLLREHSGVRPTKECEKLLPAIRETNNVIGAYLKRLPNSDYIDIFTPMLAADGRPRPELFRGDRLHLNDEGYRLWQSVIASHLQGPQGPAPLEASVAQGAR